MLSDGMPSERPIRRWLFEDRPLVLVVIAGLVFVLVLWAFYIPLRRERQVGTVVSLLVGTGREGPGYSVWTDLPDGRILVTLWGGSASCTKGDKIEVFKTFYLLWGDYIASPSACSHVPTG